MKATTNKKDVSIAPKRRSIYVFQCLYIETADKVVNPAITEARAGASIKIAAASKAGKRGLACWGVVGTPPPLEVKMVTIMATKRGFYEKQND